MPEFDVLIHNARIVDGSGKSPFKGSIGVKDEKVAAVGDVKGDAKENIDASGRAPAWSKKNCSVHA